MIPCYTPAMTCLTCWERSECWWGRGAMFAEWQSGTGRDLVAAIYRVPLSVVERAIRERLRGGRRA